MHPALAYSLPDSLSLEGALARGEALAAYARHDPAGFAFWACIWAGSLTATFLLLRMLFTHWGDTQVTRKTMALSLLLHTLAAVSSTRFDLPLRSGGESGTETVIHLHHRQIVDSNLQQLLEADAAADADSPSRTEIWNETPRFDEPLALRQPKELPETRAPVIEHEPERPEAPPEIVLPEPAAETAAPAAEPERPPAAPPRVIAAPLAQAAEETAESRAEPQNANQPDRTPREPARPIDTAPEPTVRAEAVEVVSKAGEVGAVSVESPATAPPTTVRRSEAEPAVSERAPTAPEAPQIDEVQSPVVATTEGTNKGFSRAARKSTGPLQTEPVERMRESAPTKVELPPQIATRGATDVSPRDVVPKAMRSESAGAIDGDPGQVPAPYRLRGLPERTKFAIEMGATQESERAVQASLQWLAKHQHRSGYWPAIESTLGREPVEDPPLDLHGAALVERQRSGINTEAGLTGLALLAFLGANYTHEDNVFADNVGRGLHWLIGQQRSDGFLGGGANKYARMYCHGMAAIALGEAYGMSKDPKLREPLERAIRYIVVCQNRQDGGWRYLQGYRGDMSMFGWQLMALKSARTAGLDVPDATFDRAIDFLVVHGRKQRQAGQSRYGGLAGYRVSINTDTRTETVEPPKPSMTAESLFCRQMLGIDRQHASYVEAVDYLQANLPRRSRQNLYYWYYGTLAMYQHGGDPWQHWNESLRDTLVADQRTDGDYAGSWNPRAPWGDFGGRVFSTSLSTLCLEVYYRFLPLYQFGERFEKQAERTQR